MIGTIFAAGIAAMIIGTGIGVVINLVRQGGGGEAAAWAQACGSIVAIAGAAWLARGGERQAKRARRARAEETAWYVRFSVKQAQFESQIVAHELYHRTKPVEADAIRYWRQRMITAGQVLRALMARTDYVHPASIHVAANAVVLVEEMVADLRSMGELVPETRQPDEAEVQGIVSYHLSLHQLLQEYDARLRGISEVLDRESDELPVREWIADRR